MQPDIRLDLELPPLKVSMAQHLNPYLDNMKKMIEKSLEQKLSEEYINRIVEAEAEKIIEKATVDSLKDYFGWRGKGKDMLDSYVISQIEKTFPHLDLGEKTNFKLKENDTVIIDGVAISHISKQNNYPESGTIAHKKNRIVVAHNGNWIDYDAS